MDEISLTYDGKNPQYGCSKCSHCSSTFGISLCSMKNRGCCWYFPKFTLFEIHKMVQSKEGLEVLDRIIKLPKVKIYNYYIHAKGYFDENGYNNFKKSSKSNEKPYSDHDETMFFRACPFVRSGKGCTIPTRFRSYVCNFFICDEVKKAVADEKEFANYMKERKNYVHWIDWENNSIQELLEEKKLDLVRNFDQVMEILKNMPVENYEFKKLKNIKLKNSDSYNIAS